MASADVEGGNAAMLVGPGTLMSGVRRVGEVTVRREMNGPLRGFEKRGVRQQECQGEEPADHRLL